MPKIEWRDEFSVNDKELDAQHKKWLSIYNEAHDKMLGSLPSDKKQGIGKDALDKMLEYGKYHFSYEEEHMERIGFSEIEAHRRIHSEFTKKLERISRQLRGDQYVLNSEIIKLIENWLVDHILKEDRKYIQK